MERSPNPINLFDGSTTFFRPKRMGGEEEFITALDSVVIVEQGV